MDITNQIINELKPIADKYDVKLSYHEDCSDNNGMSGGDDIYLGKITITDVVEKSTSMWFFGSYGFVMENPIKCKFYSCRGSLSLWDFDEKLLEWEY